MKKRVGYLFGLGRLTGLLAVCLVFLTNGAYGQGVSPSGATTFPCSVNFLRLRIATGGDDLRGGNDNLNVTIRFGENGFQGAANVNRGANWPNNSVRTVEIKLTHPVPLNEIKSITLDHLANGGLTISPETVLSPVGVIAGLKTADNWDMRSLEVSAPGNSVGMVILRHGPKRFTGSDAILNTRVNIPANPCAAGSAGNSGQPNSGNTPGIAGSNPAGGNSGAGSPSKKLTPQQMSALLAKVHSATPKVTPVVTNPGAGQGNMSTIGILQQQKQTALTERSQGSSTGGSTPTTPTNPANTSIMTRAASTRVPLSTAAAPPTTSTPNRTVSMLQPNVNVACATFGTAIVTAVSGQQGGTAVFTQDPQYNPFTIRGCNFGNTRGQGQLNTASGKKLADLTIDSWTDTLITAEVSPMVAGALDQDNVTLVLFPASGTQAQKPGFHFYAKRAEIHLDTIASSQVSMTPITDDQGGTVPAKFSAPYTVSPGSVSGGVDRFNTIRFPGGTDVFDFSKLKPGFVVEKFQVKELSGATCGNLGPTTTTYYTDGNWSWQLSGTTIQVTWQEAHCHDAYYGDNSNASYGLDVWLIGPVLGAGESPWQDGVK